MPRRRSRRQVLAAGAGLTALAAALPIGRLPSIRAAAPHAAASLTGADLVDGGPAFRRGVLEGTTLSERAGVWTVQSTMRTGRFTSGVLASPMAFTHLGLHWVATPAAAEACSMEVRTSGDGHVWSPWRSVRPACAARDTAGQTFGALLYTGPAPARAVQYRAQLQAMGDIPPQLERVTATVIAAPPEPEGTRLRTVTITDRTTGRTLAVTPRELWLADERLRFGEDGRGSTVWNEMFVPVKKLVVHHTETRNDYETIEAAAAEVRAIYYYHAITRGWGDIGYTALVDKFGNLYEGRYGRGRGVSRELLSADVVAGHDLSHNYGSAGVALLGSALADDWPMPTPAGPMWEALVRSSVFTAGRAFLRPLQRAAKGGVMAATSAFLRSDDQWSEQMRNVSGHRETNDTTCPGDVVVALLDALRLAIDAGLADTSRTGVTIETAGREAVVATPLRFWCTAEPPEPPWRLTGYEYSMEGWVRLPDSEDLDYLTGYRPDPQPALAWRQVDTPAPALEVEFTPAVPGHYTLHVRAVLEAGTGTSAVQRRAAYEGQHTSHVVAVSEEGADDGRDQPRAAR